MANGVNDELRASWEKARLIPVSGIGNAAEAERRAASALLAVLGAVAEFGKAVTRELGAPAGRLSVYTETPFKLDDRTVRPDGLIEVTRGKTSWTALIEVKTGPDQLQAKQLEDYLDVAKQFGFDAVVTISNEIPPMPGQHPTAVDKRRLRGKVKLQHMSWAHVLSYAVTVREHTGVTDPDQAWILSELIRYLKYPKSGALGFETMGKEWVEVREAVRAGTLRKTDKSAPVVANRYDALMQFLALELGARLGAEVTAVVPKREKEDPTLRTQALTSELVEAGSMTGTLRIPGAAGDVVIKALLRANLIECYIDLHAPQTGRNKTRISWLVRQLKEADPNLRCESFLPRAHSSAGADTLGHVRDNPEVLDVDPAKEVRSFRVAQVTRMGIKRDAGRGSFIESVATSLDTFYRDVVQNLKAWAAPAPKLDKGADNPVVSDEAVKPEVVKTAAVAVPSPSPQFGMPTGA
jgi:hypothetical protein